MWLYIYIFFFSGTRIIYDRKFLLDRRNSPIAQTPPAHLPVIPGVTSQNVLRENKKNEANKHIIKHDGKPATGKCYNIDQEIFLCNRECFVGIVISSPFLLHHVTHTLTLYVLWLSHFTVQWFIKHDEQNVKRLQSWLYVKDGQCKPKANSTRDDYNVAFIFLPSFRGSAVWLNFSYSCLAVSYMLAFFLQPITVDLDYIHTQ